MTWLRLAPLKSSGRTLDRKKLEKPLDEVARAETMVRDEYTCRRCGAPATDVHHVRTRGWRSIRWDEANLVALCRPCHDWAHAHGRTFREWWKGLQ